MAWTHVRQCIGLLALLVVITPVTVQAQAGTVVGGVTNATTNEPVNAAQVSIQGTTVGALTDAQGRFTVSGVPVGSRVVIVQRLGFTQTQQTVTVNAGAPTTLNVALSPQVLALQGIVATGLVDPVEGVRSPITVGRVDREMMPVSVAGSAVQNLQGRVAGVTMARTSGEPGEDIDIMLRSVTSLVTDNGSGQSRVSPLIVVDGVILGSGTTNIESMDIASIEVVKGAAASSLYGSRANAGVIAITTNRGQGLQLGTTQFSARSEMGWNATYSDPRQPTHHHYRVDDPVNPTTWLDATGQPTDRAGRRLDGATAFSQFQDNAYPTPLYNVMDAFQPDRLASHNFSVQQNTADTNFAVTLNRYVEGGPLENNDGLTRNSFRVNMDHRFLNTMRLGVSAYHARDHLDQTSDLDFDDLFRTQPDINLAAKDPVTGEYLRQPNPEVEFENPLWIMASREADRNRARTLGNLNLGWEPFSWMSLSGSASYDRQDSKTRRWTPKGTPEGFDGDEEDGSISFTSSISDTWNGEVQLQLRRDFGPLNVRTTIRSLIERDRNESHNSSGSNFFVNGVPTIDATPSEDRGATSSQDETRAMGYLWDNAFNYGDKYIASILVRRDGSSLFGPDNRWHTYYRTAFAWRIGEEAWFNVPHVDELKLSYSRGTAGSRPGFAQQYEVWSVGATGVSKGNLGNRDLRPEHTTEQEVSLDGIFFGKLSLQLTHAWQNTTDQLILLELPGFKGYASQWTNGGTLSGHTTELTIESNLVTTPRVQWNSLIVADRSRAKITEWPFPCTSPAWLQRCNGVEAGMIWGFVFATKLEQLTDPIIWPDGTGRPNVCHHNCTAAAQVDEFTINDEGFLVWVGKDAEGNTRHYMDGVGADGMVGVNPATGVTDDLWGTTTQIGGLTYNWGIPFNLLDGNAGFVRTQMGNASHTNLGWVNNVSFGALSLHAQLHAKIGGDGINREMQSATPSFKSPPQDQASKPEALKKPVGYYTAVQNASSGSTYWMEDTSYLKLRTLSANYRLTTAQLSRFGLGSIGITALQVGLIGRDLLTISSYRGWDAEHAFSPQGDAQVNSAGYPPTRSYTAEISVTF